MTSKISRMAAVLVFVVHPPSLVFRPTLAHARPHFQAALAARPAAAGVEASFGFGGRFGSADARREARRSGVFGRRPLGPGPMLDPVAARAQGYSGAELNRMDPRRAAAVARADRTGASSDPFFRPIRALSRGWT